MIRTAPRDETNSPLNDSFHLWKQCLIVVCRRQSRWSLRNECPGFTLYENFTSIDSSELLWRAISVVFRKVLDPSMLLRVLRFRLGNFLRHVAFSEHRAQNPVSDFLSNFERVQANQFWKKGTTKFSIPELHVDFAILYQKLESFPYQVRTGK